MNRLREKYVLIGSVPLAVILMVFLLPLCCVAEEWKYEEKVRGWTDEELVKVREWEKTWVGKKIDASNFDQVKEYFPDTWAEQGLSTKPDVWGEYYCSVAPYKQYIPVEGWRKATEAHRGQCSLDENEGMVGHISGTPFPEPTSGIELAYNFECWPQWDERHMDFLGSIVNLRTDAARGIGGFVTRKMFAERCSLEPIPEIPDNKNGIRQGKIFYLSDPPDIRGTCKLDAMYKDRNKEWDMWAYISAARRVRRMDVANRQDHTGQLDFCSDDEICWIGRINRNTYKLVGRKPLLLGRHNSAKAVEANENSWTYSGITRELTNTYEVEVTSRDPNYMYSKQVWYFFPEMRIVAFGNKYDRHGNLWKMVECVMDVVEPPGGGEIMVHSFETYLDAQRKHRTIPWVDEQFQVKPASYFTPANLNRIGR